MHTPLTSGTIKLNELSYVAFPVIFHILLLQTSDNVIVFSGFTHGTALILRYHHEAFGKNNTGCPLIGHNPPTKVYLWMIILLLTELSIMMLPNPQYVWVKYQEIVITQQPGFVISSVILYMQ